jgi:hypothetical protein
MMGKYGKELAEKLTKALGKDCGDVIAELYAIGVLDETLSRKGCAVREYLLMAADTGRYESDIRSEVAEMYCVGTTAVYEWVRSIA